MIDTHANDTSPEPADDSMTPSDPTIVELLRQAVGDVPFDAVDWHAMHRCIVGDASGMLWRRHRQPWFSYIADWSRAAASCSLVAGVAAILLLTTAPTPTQQDGTTATIPEVSPSTLSLATLLSAVTSTESVHTLTEDVARSFQADTLFARILP